MVIPMPRARRAVELSNYSDVEGRCECNCGLALRPEAALLFQAFIIVLERKLQTEVRHVITGGVRCLKHHLDVYAVVNAQRAAKGLPALTPPKDSRHLPPHCDALDGIYEMFYGGKWVLVPLDVVAEVSKNCGLFGGIGIDEYKRDGRKLIHQDCRPGPTVQW